MIDRYAKKSVSLFWDNLHNLDCFFVIFCKLVAVSDIFVYTTDLAMRKKDKTVRLGDIIVNNYWGMHEPLLVAATTLIHFRESQVFKNFFKISCTPNSTPLTVLDVAIKAVVIHATFKQHCEAQMDLGTFATVTLAYLEPMWGGIRDNILYISLLNECSFFDSSKVLLLKRLVKSRKWDTRFLP